MPDLNTNITVDVDTSLTGTTTGLNNINYLQPSAFKLTIDRKHYANLEFFCQTILHPSLSVNSTELPYRNISSIAFAGDKLTFTELTCIIIVDENLNSYTEMFNWMNRIVQTNENRPTSRTETLPPTYADITLSILSSHNNTTRKIRYIDCIPVSLGDMTLESTGGDIQYITFPVSFRFTNFELG